MRYECMCASNNTIIDDMTHRNISALHQCLRNLVDIDIVKFDSVIANKNSFA